MSLQSVKDYFRENNLPLEVSEDETLKEFDIVYPAGGTPHSAVKITVNMLAYVTKGQWINVTK